MRVVDINLNDLATQSIYLGYAGEKNHVKVIIHCPAFFRSYPDAVATMVARPPVGDLYPVILERVGKNLVWEASEADLAYAGSGDFQITFTQDGEVVKTAIGHYSVNSSLVATGEAPEPIEEWVEEANAILAEFGSIADLSASATTLEAGADATAAITTVDGHKNIAIGIPTGPKGEKGDKGADGNPAPAEAVADAVDEYLAENFSNPSNPPLDRSLASSLSAAPADLVGHLKDTVNSNIFGAEYTQSGLAANDYFSFKGVFFKGEKFRITNGLSGSCTVNIIESDGTSHSLSGNVPAGSSSDFAVEYDECKEIRGYCGAGGSVTLTVYSPIDEVDARIDRMLSHLSYDEFFEMGNIYIDSNGWSYNSSTTRVRTKNGYAFPLDVGAIIGLTSYTDYRYYVGWKRENGTYGYAGWLTKDFNVTEKGNYVVLISNITEKTVADPSDLSSLFFGAPLTVFYEDIYQKIDINQPSATSSDVGKFLKLKTIDSNGKPTAFEYGEGGSSGTEDYSDLSNKPQINGVTLSGNKTSDDLSIPKTTDFNDLLFKTCGYSESIVRTVSSDTTQEYSMKIPIKQGSTFRILNTASSDMITVNIVNETGSEIVSKGNLFNGDAMVIVAPFDVYTIRSYVLGTSFSITVDVYGNQDIEIGEIKDLSESNRASLGASGYRNIFKIDYTQRTTNGMTIKDITDQSVVLNGTATANTNFEIAFESFPVTPNMVMYIDCPETMAGETGVWLQPGALASGGSVDQPARTVLPNTITNVVFRDGYVSSRCYLHINSGVTLNNAKIVFFAASYKPFDGDTVQSNTFMSDYTDGNYLPVVDAVNSKVLATNGNNEQFLFFTDPHLAVQSGGGAGMSGDTIPFINYMEAVYNASPMSFCVCGGDWLGNGDSKTVAASKLTTIDGFMRKKFKKFYPINGNHDTNYQGAETIDNDLLKSFTDKFREEGRMYYSFDAPSSKWYVFDTGIESEQIGIYQNEQLEWFANSLLSDNSEHIVISLHIIFPSTAGGSTQPITDEILTIAEKYNARESVTVNGTAYNYSASTGSISFCLAGHLHQDWNGTIHDIPCVITTNSTSGGKMTFDLCVVDWDEKKLYTKRVGTGSDRTITIL